MRHTKLKLHNRLETFSTLYLDSSNIIQKKRENKAMFNRHFNAATNKRLLLSLSLFLRKKYMSIYNKSQKYGNSYLCLMIESILRKIACDSK